ncbi:hypothetical protein SAMN05216251_10989 [Actinacidiphila alni]|uniref:Uncharacterized protein n=1 Tax=Actinacidiphila alni TaxID=380248 RepID=A0A1I2GH45_9ACTN|nr:hypothetical protein [Actinacidiphila alni]SFF17154.1 hypothetical protein SAMN05216251_10989 [Actinacidiphila alni]
MADRTDRADRAGLPDRLRDAAGAHRPDRDRMLARVERGMADEERAVAARDTADPPPGPVRDRPPGAGAPWLRIAAVTAAVAGAIGIGGLAVGAVTGDGEPTRSVVTSTGPAPSQRPTSHPAGPTSPAAHPGTRQDASPSAGRHAKGATHPVLPPSGGTHRAATTPPPSSATATGSGSAGGGSTSPGDGTAQDGALSARASVDGASNPSWTQSDLVLTTTRPLTSLTVEVRVARTAGVSSTGSWTTESGATAATVSVEGDDLVYRWTLDSGQTLAAGDHTFSAQFDHAQGDRDAGGDRYSVQAQGPDGPLTVDGRF